MFSMFIAWSLQLVCKVASCCSSLTFGAELFDIQATWCSRPSRLVGTKYERSEPVSLNILFSQVGLWLAQAWKSTWFHPSNGAFYSSLQLDGDQVTVDLDGQECDGIQSTLQIMPQTFR
jgi:hypothetical protein